MNIGRFAHGMGLKSTSDMFGIDARTLSPVGAWHSFAHHNPGRWPGLAQVAPLGRAKTKPETAITHVLKSRGRIDHLTAACRIKSIVEVIEFLVAPFRG